MIGVAFERPAFYDHAACVGLDPGLFFPPRGASTAAVNKALLVCATCCVRTQCKDYALAENLTSGIFGGMTGRERRVELRRRRLGGGRVRFPYWRWRRRAALTESRAVRALYCAHGRIPTHGSTDWWAAWLDACEPPELQPCGTRAAALRHQRKGEMCDLCRGALAAHARELRLRKKVSA